MTAGRRLDGALGADAQGGADIVLGQAISTSGCGEQASPSTAASSRRCRAGIGNTRWQSGKQGAPP
jgi:hypothetical protein